MGVGVVKQDLWLKALKLIHYLVVILNVLNVSMFETLFLRHKGCLRIEGVVEVKAVLHSRESESLDNVDGAGLWRHIDAVAPNVMLLGEVGVNSDLFSGLITLAVSSSSCLVMVVLYPELHDWGFVCEVIQVLFNLVGRHDVI